MTVTVAGRYRPWMEAAALLQNAILGKNYQNHQSAKIICPNENSSTIGHIGNLTKVKTTDHSRLENISNFYQRRQCKGVSFV